MTGKEFLDKLYQNLLRIDPLDKNLQFYLEIGETFNDFQIIDSFYQFKKNEEGEGLALEIMFFNSDFMHDIVISRTSIEHVSILTKSIIASYIETSFKESKNEKGEVSIVENLTLHFFAGEDHPSIFYTTDIKRFTELYRIKNNLLKTIIL